LETARDRGQGKYELITKLTSEGVYEFMLALLARNRFSRPVVEKALSVIIIFCRFNRPLEKSITEFLWKVLGTTGRDER
jgi:signal-transduction protein with cAMP-binding, CBS, and nucleotidyltransferase domain